MGHNIIYTDIDEKKIGMFNAGQMPIYEPGLEELVFKNKEKIMIAVGTPTKENYESDLRALYAVARSIGDILVTLDDYKGICIKSTVPVGTNEKIKEFMVNTCGVESHKFDLVSNPEFLRAGSALKDLYEKTFMVLGGDFQRALDNMTELKVVKGMSFNDIVLPFKNVKPGPGLGGSCLPKDTRAFVKMAEDREVDFAIIKAVIDASGVQKLFIVNQLYNLLGKNVKDKTVGVLGLSFKANTDDIRKSPAIVVIDQLLKDGACVKAYDPVATENMRGLFPDVNYCDSVYDAVKDVDVIIALTDWKEIKEIDLKKVSSLVKNKMIVDARNMFDPSELKENGFVFVNLGRR